VLADRPFLGILIVAVVVLACAEQAPTPSAEPAQPTAPASPSMEAAHVLSPAEVAQAIAVRREFGLREDEAWVRAVAANPAAVMDFGVPLMPFERDEIMRRPNGEEGITIALQDYLGEHADVSGGLYIDQARGGIVTILVTDDPAPHQAALAELIGADAPVAVRQVRWTESQLRDLQERIGADQAFLASLPAQMKSSGVLIVDNVVELSISSAVPDAGERIAAHFGANNGMLRVDSDGTGILLQPSGRILGRVIAPPGTDMTRLSPQYEADVDIGGRDSIGIGVAPDGTFVIDDLPPATYTVTILELGDVENIEVGRGTVVVPPGAAVALEIPLRRP
jgi:hypothetical protein